MKLNEQYNRSDFELFLESFLPEDYKSEKKDIELDERYKVIKSAKVLGDCASVGLKVIELKHEKERDPRITLAGEAFKIMADSFSRKALVVFKSNNSNNWRLSYITITLDINEKNKVVQSFSNPRRKSFYLGPDAKTATPYKFLIKQDRIKTAEDLDACFDVEVVTKEFFNNYRELYNKLSDYLKKDNAFNAFAGNNNIKLDDFAKKLLGQIVFIYFLQKKGWLGAKKEAHIYEGDSGFLRSLYTKCRAENKNYFNDYLEYLFYNAFNKEPEKAGSFYREYFDCQIPFLNGGLFEPLNGYNWQQSFLHIPNELFSNENKDGILDIFDLYNFTIDENSPVDQEVSVDPEMLGKVFEKLLDTNKETGSFYTPREIVSYMVKQSLIEYLKTNTCVKEEDIEKLVNDHRTIVPELDKKEYKEIEEALKEIKIIDPAVGSGAYPVGILQEMAEIRKICLDKTTIKPRLPYDIKREILENNIYGVDIDHGAIDIARLRFWLSLVVDAELADVEPLPNLEFKLIAANTLLKLDGEEGLYDEENLLGRMKELREKYFRARTKNGKEKIQNDFKKMVSKSNHMFATDRQKQIMTYDPFSPTTVAQFFDSEFMFGIKKFDLVIGNPPYIDSETMVNTGQSDLRDFITKNYKLTKGNWDIYIAFFELGLSILSINGVLTYITPDKWISKPFGNELRINTIGNLLSILNAGRKVFETAKVDSIVTLFKNCNSKKIKVFEHNSGAIVLKRELDKSILKSPYCLDFVFSTHLDLLIKIETNENKLIDYCECENACATSDAYKLKEIIKNIPENDFSEDYYKIINTGTINKYYSLWGIKEMTYLKDKYLCPVVLKKEFVALFSNTYSKKTAKSKLIIKGLTLLDACLDENGIIVPGKSTLVIPSDNIDDLKFLLGIINSSLPIFYIKEKYSASSYNGGINFTKDMINNLPLPNVLGTVKNIIIGLVNNILEKRKTNASYDITEIQNEINRAVYRLYGLTKEEISLIEK